MPTDPARRLTPRQKLYRARVGVVEAGTTAYRRATARARVLPHVVNIGVQKGGTTTLFHHLAQHPQLVPSYDKEVHYFDGGLDPGVDTYLRGPDWYRSNFPLRRRLTADQRAFEASPLYLLNPLAPERMRALLPDVRLIVLLRDPVERALSHYFHQVRKGREPLPPAEAFAAEDARLAGALTAEDYKSASFIHHSYKRRGQYAAQLRRYHEHFPADQLLVLSSEEYFADPAGQLRSVFAFVGVDPEVVVPDLAPRNVGTNRGAVDAAVYDGLAAHFRPHNDDLYGLLGRDLGWGRSGP